MGTASPGKTPAPPVPGPPRESRASECHPGRGALSLPLQQDLGLAPRTVEAYARALADYLAVCGREGIAPVTATRSDIARYVRDLTQRPNPRGGNVLAIDSGIGLANATLQQRLTAVRLFYDHLIEEGQRETNPVGRGRYTPCRAFGGQRECGLIPRFTKLPWIPTDAQWTHLLEQAKVESIRNRNMLALAYDAALRREELCALRTDDLDPAQRMLRIQAETTKNRLERLVPYSPATAILLQDYVRERLTLSTARGPLFLSASHRNEAAPLTLWTWSKVVRALAVRAEAVVRALNPSDRDRSIACKTPGIHRKNCPAKV